MTDTSERDRLAELLAEHAVWGVHSGKSVDGKFPSLWTACSCGSRESEDHLCHLADVLLANGWSRVVPRPDVEAEVEWGVRWTDSTGHVWEEPSKSRADAEESVGYMKAISVGYSDRLIFRTVGPWQEAL